VSWPKRFSRLISVDAPVDDSRKMLVSNFWKKPPTSSRKVSPIPGLVP
jgi:hypothetical protein